MVCNISLVITSDYKVSIESSLPPPCFPCWECAVTQYSRIISGQSSLSMIGHNDFFVVSNQGATDGPPEFVSWLEWSELNGR